MIFDINKKKSLILKEDYPNYFLVLTTGEKSYKLRSYRDNIVKVVEYGVIDDFEFEKVVHQYTSDEIKQWNDSYILGKISVDQKNKSIMSEILIEAYERYTTSHPEYLEPQPENRTIPKTKIRYLYEMLKEWNIGTHKNILESYKEKPNKLYNIWYSSVEHFSKYSNIEESFVGSNRSDPMKDLDKDIKSTMCVISKMINQKNVTVVNNSEYNFVYLDYELSPFRTTKSMFDNGNSAKSSGTGGIDYFGLNKLDNYPIIGEIKIKNDSNPFYALIQTLCYASELVSINQKNRLAKYYPDLNIEKFYIHISVYEPDKNQLEILRDTKRLVKSIMNEEDNEIKNHIKDILFFEIKIDDSKKISLKEIK